MIQKQDSYKAAETWDEHSVSRGACGFPEPEKEGGPDTIPALERCWLKKSPKNEQRAELCELCRRVIQGGESHKGSQKSPLRWMWKGEGNAGERRAGPY